MPGTWQRLHLSNEGGIPPLLFRYSPTASSYELHMTDLNYIWLENLERKDILKRADEDETTIDPSEDLEQFKVLLQKIGEGLQNETGSKTVLNPQTRGDAHALELTVTSKLPAPLKPLQWKLYLSRQPQSSTTSHLLLPFIRAEADREARQKSLIEELGKKDWVLQKLFDKIEAMGIDLSAIFPGTSGLRGGRKGPMLAQAAKYIKGLAPFDEQSWREKVDKASPDSGLAANIVAEMSVDSDIPGQLDSLNPPTDGWWKSLTISNSRTSHSTPQDKHGNNSTTKTSADAMETGSSAGTETDVDDDFERQETSPGLKKPKSSTPQKSPANRKHNAEATKTEDEEASPPLKKRAKETKTRVEHHPPPAMRPKATPAGTGKPKGLGTIGGKKQSEQKEPSSTPSLSPSPPPKRRQSRTPSPPPRKQQPQSPVINNNDETTDDEGSESHSHISRPEPKSKPAQSGTKPGPKQSRGLGLIGGKKKKQPTLTPEPEPEPEPEPNPSKPQPPDQAPLRKKKPLGKIGLIGGQKAKAKPASSVEPTSSKTESISPPPKSKSKQTQEQDTETDNDDGEEVKKGKEEPPAPSSDKKVKPKPEPSPAPAREETEEEKADRKREELKRQLEAKSKAPVKKKRRF
ncbi:XRCC4-like factor-domain-containing protein [Aspergillus spectabilis]